MATSLSKILFRNVFLKPGAKMFTSNHLHKDIREVKKIIADKEPHFPIDGKFSKENLTKYSLRHLYRLRQQEKASISTKMWYDYPANIKEILNWCIAKKKKEDGKD